MCVMLNVNIYRTDEINPSIPKPLHSQSNEFLWRSECSLSLEIQMVLFHSVNVLICSIVLWILTCLPNVLLIELVQISSCDNF